jgi:L,D-peptidoglycan transpeptidase YkuD (ErfK/YbiS/YcfS/YnhG family)
MWKAVLVAGSLCVAVANALSCSQLQPVDSLVTQVLVVEAKPNEKSKATIASCEKLSNGTWVNALSTYDCVVGTNGISAPRRMKEEGDNLTPSGFFSLGEFFGWSTTADPEVQKFKSDYRYIADVKDGNGYYLDKFVDDVESPYYNTWVSGATTATSFEQMRISAYKYGLVINYNMYPTIPGTLAGAEYLYVCTLYTCLHFSNLVCSLYDAL